MIEPIIGLIVFVVAFVLVTQYVPAPSKNPLLIVIGVALVIWVLFAAGIVGRLQP